MIAKIIPLFLLLTVFISTAKAEHNTVYKFDRPIKSVIDEYVDVPDIVRNANIKITVEAYPKSKYYKTRIELLQPYNKVCRFTKTLEVWDREQVIKSTVDIDLNIRIRFLKRIIERKVEQTILSVERKFLQEKLKLER
jgi:hypothetical protein